MSQDKMREALRIFVGCQHPVSAEINPRGYQWVEAYLDKALPIALAALSEPPEPADRERIIERVPKPDEDGHCVICGLEWPNEQETLEPHECPPGFRALKTIPSQTTQREPRVMVPREPTKAMCKAGAPHCKNNSFTAMMVYCAMLAAAHLEPQQPRAPGDESN